MIAALVNEDGCHGFEIVAFNDEAEARAWCEARKLNCIIRPLLDPDDWSSADDDDDA